MEIENPVLHVIVVGFHHKKGCQVEFSYPPLVADTLGKNECPSGWKYLPTLALPDGSHNFSSDFVCFNLPSLVDPQKSVYGISCYRQIAIEDVKIRTADLTRSTVQKAVCALLSIPIYGYVEVKLSLIARAFFEQGDFSCTDILVKAFEQLNACLICLEPRDIAPSRLHFIGIPLRELLLKWRHKILILFKLLLLQKRVVCFGSPVKPMCALILGVASLHPELISNGFQQVACVKISRTMQALSTLVNDGGIMQSNASQPNSSNLVAGPGQNYHHEDKQTENNCHEAKEEELILESMQQMKGDSDDVNRRSVDSTKEFNLERGRSASISSSSSQPSSVTKGDDDGTKVWLPTNAQTLARETSVDTIASNFSSLCAIDPEEWGAPLHLFHDGYLCLPYLSLPYMDLLSDPSVKGYIIGASNVLFQHKRQLADVMIDIENMVIDALDLDTKRQIQLSTEDLRFVDFVVRNVQTPREDAEGSESWIREQLYGYTVALLKSSLNTEGSKEFEHFNVHFMAAFKATYCYDEWYKRMGGGVVPAFDSLHTGHPFAGTLSIADMKLKIAQTIQNTEGGRKLNQAVISTSRVVGGALTTAKGAFSSWWTSVTAPPVGDPLLSTISQQANNASVAAVECGLKDDENEREGELVCENQTCYGATSTPTTVAKAEFASQQQVRDRKAVIEIGKEAELLNQEP
ncbi:late secretory pathway protein AVL9 homolog [Anopheles bellator]|uniref:late secretory pathway protein AVL9 homolog n=1 Tax=Anopheles bellator TaxID=139047 RepID=UPI0026475CB2|nr:late secretory pathway protein AVL9 homolog [Anopheles bellator]